MQARNILIGFSLKYSGDWEKIINAIETKEPLKEEEVISQMSEIKSNVITLLDEDYPDYLKELYRPPFVLYYYGDISLIKNYEDNLSVVGSREASEYGLSNTKKVVSEICNEFNIVSGCARGIDAAAHLACLKNGGKTIGVLGCGIDTYYPKENYKLINEIKKKGLLLSEYPCKTPCFQEAFRMRNRIIAYISRGTLVAEAKLKSGTMLTVKYALSFNRDIMAFPYNISEDNGCNMLISQGATLVQSAEDVREMLNRYGDYKKS